MAAGVRARAPPPAAPVRATCEGAAPVGVPWPTEPPDPQAAASPATRPRRGRRARPGGGGVGRRARGGARLGPAPRRRRGRVCPAGARAPRRCRSAAGAPPRARFGRSWRGCHGGAACPRPTRAAAAAAAASTFGRRRGRRGGGAAARAPRFVAKGALQAAPAAAPLPLAAVDNNHGSGRRARNGGRRQGIHSHRSACRAGSRSGHGGGGASRRATARRGPAGGASSPPPPPPPVTLTLPTATFGVTRCNGTPQTVSVLDTGSATTAGNCVLDVAAGATGLTVINGAHGAVTGAVQPTAAGEALPLGSDACLTTVSVRVRPSLQSIALCDGTVGGTPRHVRVHNEGGGATVAVAATLPTSTGPIGSVGGTRPRGRPRRWLQARRCGWRATLAARSIKRGVPHAGSQPLFFSGDGTELVSDAVHGRVGPDKGK